MQRLLNREVKIQPAGVAVIHGMIGIYGKSGIELPVGLLVGDLLSDRLLRSKATMVDRTNTD